LATGIGARADAGWHTDEEQRGDAPPDRKDQPRLPAESRRHAGQVDAEQGSRQYQCSPADELTTATSSTNPQWSGHAWVATTQHNEDYRHHEVSDDDRRCA